MNTFVREFNGSDADYTACIDLHNKAWPEYYRSEKVYRYSDASRNPKYYFKRMIAEKGGVPVGLVEYMEEWESEDIGDYFAMFSVDPAADFLPTAEALFDALMADIHSKNGTKLNTVFLEDRPKMKRFLEAKKFSLAQREPRSTLNVETFDFGRFAKLEAKLTAEGVEITNLPNLKEQYPDWQRRIYNLEWPIVQDIPIPFPVKREPFEDFIKLFNHPNYLPESDFYAVENGAWVGLSNIKQVDGQPDVMSVGLTGILRSHRRRGIATALKVKTIEYAKQNGVKVIKTDNEENNPMYDLNLQLGFEPKPALLNYELKIEPQQ